MEKIGELEIQVVGKFGKLDLTPDNYDIRQILILLENVEDLLYPNATKNRPLITYKIGEGSVRNLFKTPVQYIIGFSAILSQIKETQSIDFLDLKTARALENIQVLSQQKNYHFEFRTSIKNEVELSINPGTNYFRTESSWVDAEFYFYGILTNAGGKTKANIHLDTLDYGILTIETSKDYLEGKEENFLYKKFGVRVMGKQDSKTGEIDTKSLSLIEIIDYNPKYDDNYLNSLIKKAKESWKGVNTDDWLNDIRGGYEA